MSFLPLLQPNSKQPKREAISKRIAVTACAMGVLLCGSLASNQCANATSPASKPASGSFTGLSHYYADNLHGKRTASGQAHDRNKMTAAHRTLPFGTRLHVTNKKNGKTCEVVVNDRGPFHPKFSLDLSQAAARELGFFNAGKGLLECIILDEKAIVDSIKHVAIPPPAKPAVAQQVAPSVNATTPTVFPLAIGIVKPAVQAKTAPGPVVPVTKVMPVIVSQEAPAQEIHTAHLPINDKLPTVFADESSTQHEHHGILNPTNEIADNVAAHSVLY